MSKSNNTARMHTSAIHKSQVPEHASRKKKNEEETMENKNVSGWMEWPSPPLLPSVSVLNVILLFTCSFLVFFHYFFFSVVLLSMLLEWHWTNIRRRIRRLLTMTAILDKLLLSTHEMAINTIVSNKFCCMNAYGDIWKRREEFAPNIYVSLFTVLLFTFGRIQSTKSIG